MILRTMVVGLGAGVLLALAVGNTVSAADLDVIDVRQLEPVVGDVAAGQQKAQVCSNCHGANGKAPIAEFPSMAGLPAGYLYWKLVAFKESSRADSIMTPLVTANSLEDLRDMAVFYASLPLEAASPLSAAPVADDVLAHGRELYLRGDPQRGIPGCQGCHGPQGKGPPHAQAFQANWPPLYGQQAAYVAERLTKFRDGYAIDSTMDKIMQGVARRLETRDIEALAAHVERLDGR